MVATWLRTNGYDVAPIVDGNTRVGYVALEDLMYAPPDDLIADHAQGTSLDRIISVDAAFGDVLAALYESPFYLPADRTALPVSPPARTSTGPQLRSTPSIVS